MVCTECVAPSCQPFRTLRYGCQVPYICLAGPHEGRVSWIWHICDSPDLQHCKSRDTAWAPGKRTSKRENNLTRLLMCTCAGGDPCLQFAASGTKDAVGRPQAWKLLDLPSTPPLSAAHIERKPGMQGVITGKRTVHPKAPKLYAP